MNKSEKVLLWLAGALLAVSILFPNGPDVFRAPAPVVPVVPKVTDAAVLKILAPATPAELTRIEGVYSALAAILPRDAGKLIVTTEQWETLQANTLKLAIESPGKYVDLDEAIETVFLKTVGTDDVLPNNAETQKKLVIASEIVANTAAELLAHPVAPVAR